jgi:ABC-2 type transport system ATP-binding protein
VVLLDEPTSGLDPLMEQVFRECVREVREDGRTVFLSSHILSEVEATCDRVAMLRGGRIIETGRLEELRGIAALQVEVRFDGPVPDLSAVQGVQDVTVHGATVTCRVTGDVQPLLAALAAASVQHLVTREPSLEELFVSRYGASTDQAA